MIAAFTPCAAATPSAGAAPEDGSAPPRTSGECFFPSRRVGLRVAGAAVPGEATSSPLSPGTVSLSERGQVLLRLICEAQRIDPAEAVLRALATYAADKVGLPGLLGDNDVLTAEGLRTGRDIGRDGRSALRPEADHQFCVGRAAVARRSHKPEVAGSNPAPATSIQPEGSNRGGGGNPAVPASAAGPP